MRIVDIREHTVPISRHADPALPSGGSTTSVVALVTDAVRNGRPAIGYGFSSFGRFGQGGLIRERFAPRTLPAADQIGRASCRAKEWQYEQIQVHAVSLKKNTKNKYIMI